MIKSQIGFICIFLLESAHFAPNANADEQLSFDTYSCQTFLDDVQQKTDAERLWRSTMFIAWSAGYASAFQKPTPRPNAKSMVLIGATLGALCKSNPTGIAVDVFKEKIENLAKEDN